MTQAAQPFIDSEIRSRFPENKFGIGGIDHVGLGCRDPELSGKFIEEILGGVEVFRFGFSEEEKAAGRLRHIFFHFGPNQLEVVEQEDGKTYQSFDTINSQPHWAFRMSPSDIVKFTEHLRRHKIPFSGPRSHTGASAVSVYFRDPDGNNLEVTTWEKMPDDVELTGMKGGVPWSDLAHSWRPSA